MKCNICEELNEEKEKIKIDGIEIQNVGYYNYHIPIYCCPICGERLNKYKDYTIEQLLNRVV